MTHRSPGRTGVTDSTGLHRPFLIFFTLPALLATALLGLGALSVWVDHLADQNGFHVFAITPSAATAVDFHAAVATGAITALSLAYSLTLIVFTLAAGNIGPRLLQRFTSELTIQITAGIFGGTFLFALNALFFTRDDFVPEITTLLTAALALICVVQLIYFVRHVASNVTIDDEISAIGQSLSREIDQMMQRGTDAPDRDASSAANALSYTIDAPEDGYLTRIDQPTLIGIATDCGVCLRFQTGVGGFVLAGVPLIVAEGQDRLTEDTIKALLGAISLSPSRSQAQSVDFSIRLLLEIALRGLSPGVNDTFTAIACVNRISSALSRPVSRMSDGRHLPGPDGDVRVVLPGSSVAELLDLAFSPLRDAICSNLLIATHIAGALRQLDQIAHPKAAPLLAEHAGLLLDKVAVSEFLPEDRRAIRQSLGDLGKRLDPSRGRAETAPAAPGPGGVHDDPLAD